MLFGLVEQDALGSRLLAMRSPQYEVIETEAGEAGRGAKPGARTASPLWPRARRATAAVEEPRGAAVRRGAPGVHTGRIVPVYEKLGPLTVKPLRRVLAQLAAQVPADLADPLPEELRERLDVIGRGEALRRVHLPDERRLASTS